MKAGLDMAFFGASLAFPSWDGATTCSRGIVRALAERGHHVTFYEPDAFERRAHRPPDDPAWARVVTYEPTEESAARMLAEARHADVLVKASGVGVLDDFLEREVLAVKRPGALAVFWDIDAPATLARLRERPDGPFAALVPRWDAVLVHGGGVPVVSGYREFGARTCVPIHGALDPRRHGPATPDPRFACELAFLGDRQPDREARVDEFFLRAAIWAPSRSFLLGGSGWEGKAVPQNVRRLGHVFTRDHDALSVTPLAVLDVSRESMTANGWSPATRVFETAGVGGCVITDAWEGIANFLEPDREVLVANDGSEVAAHLERLTPARAREIGRRARARILANHTCACRALDVEAVLEGRLEHMGAEA